MAMLKFIFSLLFLFYIPGYALLNRFKKDCAIFEKIILSFCLGLLIVPQVYFYFESSELRSLFLIVMFTGSFLYFVYKLNKVFLCKIKERRSGFNLRLTLDGIFLGVLIFIILSICLAVLGTSGIAYNDGMRFYQANAFDSVGQMAMVGELAKNSPHEFPFYSGLPLKGYYVGAFYWRAIIYKLTSINPMDLFFRFSPLVLFPLVALMAYLSVKKLTENNYSAILATFFIFLMSDLSWLFPIMDRIFAFKEIKTIAFQGDFLPSFMANPPLAHGILIFFTGCYFLKDIYTYKGKQILWPFILLTGFFFGILYEYKAFMWAVLLPALILVGIKEYFYDKRDVFLKIAAVTAIFSFLSFLKISSGQHTLSLFRFNIGYFPLDIFKQIGLIGSERNASFFIIIAAFLFYFIGTLGIKVVGFLKLGHYVKFWRNISAIKLFLTISMIFSFVFTHTFLLKSNYFYATQNFFIVFLLTVSIFAAEAIISWSKKQKFILKVLFFSIIFVIGIGSTAFSFLGYFPKYSKYKAIPVNILEAADYIKETSKEDSVILHNLNQRYWLSQAEHLKLKEGGEGRDSFISALTGRRVVSECNWHMNIAGYAEDLDRREKDIVLFFNTNNKNVAREILDRYKVDYVWIEEEQDLHFRKDDILRVTFLNPSVKIYIRE